MIVSCHRSHCNLYSVPGHLPAHFHRHACARVCECVSEAKRMLRLEVCVDYLFTHGPLCGDVGIQNAASADAYRISTRPLSHPILCHSSDSAISRGACAMLDPLSAPSI